MSQADVPPGLVTAPAPDGTPIACSRTGRIGADPVLLLPGQTLDHTMWDSLVPFLADLDVLAPDPRGTGASGAGSDLAYSVELLADDVVAVLDALELPRAHVIGFSMGGRVAQVLATRHPDRLGALVLAATTPGGPHQVERPAAASRALRHLRGTQARRRMAELFFTPDFCDAHPEVVQSILPRVPAEISRAHFHASSAHDTWSSLTRIVAPTLVVHGHHDELTPVGNALLLESCIGPASLLTIAEARHGVLHEYSSEVMPVIQEHLRRHRLDGR